jgi:hypothetical protein
MNNKTLVKLIALRNLFDIREQVPVAGGVLHGRNFPGQEDEAVHIVFATGGDMFTAMVDNSNHREVYAVIYHREGEATSAFCSGRGERLIRQYYDWVQAAGGDA